MIHAIRTCITVLVLVLLSGCTAIHRDQEKISEALFWTDAQIKASPARDPDAQRIEIVAGDSVILMTHDGYTHGRTSSAHASHHAVFCTLPPTLVEGRTYRVSSADGTLHYDGFAGYNHWYIDPDHPAWATVQINSILTDSVNAHVKYEMTRVCRARWSPPEQRQRLPLTKDEKAVFKRAELRR